MNIIWENVQEYFEDNKTWVHDTELYWYHQLWVLLEKNNLTVANSLVEKLSVYSRIYAMIAIYKEFCEAAFGEHPDFDVEFSLPELDDETEGVFLELIQDSDTRKTIFELMIQNSDIDSIFASLWYSALPNELDTPINTYEEYCAVISNLTNTNLSTDKQAAYRWLTDNI